MEFVVRTIRTLFYSLDRVIYGLIGDVYGLLVQLSRTSVFSQETINEFSKRIYALVGLFMLFKISVSLINYVLNPDDFSDKEKGFTQIIKRVILSLVMIVLMPYIFTEAYELQAIILEENTLMNVIFGAPAGGSELTPATAIQSAGQKIAFTVMYAFAQPNYEEFTQSDSDSGSFDLINCQQAYAQYEKVTATDEANGIHVGDYMFETRIGEDSPESSTSKFIYKLNEKCWGVKQADDLYHCDESVDKNNQIGSLCILFSGETETGGDYSAQFQDYAHGVAEQNFSLFFRKEVILAREAIAPAKGQSRRYFVNYKMGISTAVGVAVLYLFLMFCIDIAVRSIKLGFLQMIAPIPILSYCDPKSSKDGMFSKWVHMCVSTYLELFFRLAALYFGIYIISLVGTFRDVVSGKTVNGPIVSVFMIIGILVFVRKLPDIIKDIFNIKGNGKFTLNPMKKLQEDALGGKAIAGIGKKAVGLGAGLGTAGLVGAAGLMTGQGIHKGALGKAIAGGWRGDKFGKNFASSYGAGRERHKQLQDMKAEGVGRIDQAKAQLASTFGSRGSERINDAVSAAKSIQDDYKAYETAASKSDKVASLFAKKRDAAIQAGNDADAATWSKAFDNRMAQIGRDKGKVITKLADGTTAEELLSDRASGQVIDGDDLASYATETKTDTTLTSLDGRIRSKASRANASYSNIDGYTKITEADDATLKDISDGAGSAQRGVEASSENAKKLAASKFVSGGKK